MSSPLPHHQSVLTGLTMGTWLNPVNSTMITVALVAIAADFGVDFVAVSWTVTVFYLVSCTAQPVLGRCADRFGPKRVFLAGMLVVLIATIWSALAGSVLSLSLARGLLALGTACAYPAAVTLLGAWIPPGPESVRALGRIQLVNILGMAIGPVLGGLLLAGFGWHAQFWLNIPPAVLALVLIARFAPPDAVTAARQAGTSGASADRPSVPEASVTSGTEGSPAAGAGGRRAGLLLFVDAPGILGFTVAMGALILALLDSVPGMRGWLLLAAVLSGALFVIWELRAPHPVLDLRELAANSSLLLVLAQFAAFNVVFYLWLFGFPQYFEIARGYSVAQVGLLMAVLAIASALSVWAGARYITRWGLKPFLFSGLAVAIGALGLIRLVGLESNLMLDVAMLAAVGIPYGLIPLGLNQGMFASARRGSAGVAAGLFQLTRYLGAIIAIVIMALIVGDDFSPARWQPLVLAMAVTTLVAAVLVVLWRAPDVRGTD